MAAMPFCKPTMYSRDEPNRKSSKLDPPQVIPDRVPRDIRVRPINTIPGYANIARVLETLLNSDTYPEGLFDEPNGSLHHLSTMSSWEAETRTPSGESGVSHFIKSALFNKLNVIVREVFPEKTRYWAVIGIGSTGKTDWGYFVNGVLALIVEIKPHSVSRISPSDSNQRRAHKWVYSGIERVTYDQHDQLHPQKSRIDDDWSKSSVKYENVMYRVSSPCLLRVLRGVDVCRILARHRLSIS